MQADEHVYVVQIVIQGGIAAYTQPHTHTHHTLTHAPLKYAPVLRRVLVLRRRHVQLQPPDAVRRQLLLVRRLRWRLPLLPGQRHVWLDAPNPVRNLV